MNKYQTGNKILPTAQHASIKYNQGTKHIYPNFVWDSKLDPKKDIRGVRANNPLHSEPGEIMREILYSPSTNQPVDTTYREYPTALLPVKIQTRVASSNDQDRKEYETLKRRFDTAWKVSRPHIRYGIFKEGGMIPKYQVGAYFVPYKDGRNTNIMGRGSGKHYTAQEVKDWLREHNIEITDKQFDNWLVNSNPISYTEYLNWNKSQPTQDNTNKFQWNNKYWSKISNKYKGLGYNEYMQEFNKWFDQQNFNSLEKDNRNYIAKQNWDRYVKLGYNKPVNTLNDAIVTPAKPKQKPPTNEQFDLNKNGYVKSTPTDTGKNTAETVKPESETIKPEKQKQVTYSDILLKNTDIIKNKIFNSGWRGAFKDSLNRALMTPDYYNNGDGTQVYDFQLPDGTIVNYDYLSENEMLNKHGLLKAGAMRKLAKNFKQQGRNIAQQRYIGIGNQQILNNSTPVVNIADTYEPNYGIKMIGATTPTLGPDWNGMKNEVEKYQQKEPDITV